MDILVQKLLLVAKHNAWLEERGEISTLHLRKAALSLPEAREILSTLYEVPANRLPRGERIKDDTLDSAARAPEIKLSPEVNQVLMQSDAGKDFEKLISTIKITIPASLISHLKKESLKLEEKISMSVDEKKEESKDETEPKEAPVLTILKSIPNIKKELENIVFGQPQAIEAICDGLVRQTYRASDHAPAAILLFVGPSATGKTLLATSLACALGEEWKSISVYMENMLADNQGHEINGLPEGYLHHTSGKVTDFVRRNPKSVVVFENFDKAHPNVREILSSILATGTLVDSFGFFERDSRGEYDTSEPIAEPEVSFNQSIVIFTTNGAEEAYDSPSFQKLVKTNPSQVEANVLNALGREKESNKENRAREAVSPAFLSGLSAGATVLFDRLTLDTFTEIAKQGFEKTFSRLKGDLGCEIKCTQMDLVCKACVLSESPNVTAVSVSNDLVEKLIDPLMDYITEHQFKVPESVDVRFAKGEKKKLEEILSSFDGDEPVNQMFRMSQTLKVQVRAVEEKEGLVLELSAIKLQRISFAHDFEGQGAIRAEVPDISFGDIAGHHVVKRRMVEIVKLLKDPDYIQGMGVDVPKGLLLWGEPGTGKTLLAKALANEADLPFIATTGSEILDPDLLKTIFIRARKYAPSILFIDEIDAIGKRSGGGIDTRINQLLTEIDGFDTSLFAPVFIIAATNLPEKIDDAILRSGRIDLKVEVPLLDRDARNHFIEKYFELPHDGSLDKNNLLNFTSGMTGADLEKVLRETVLEMVSSDKEKVSMEMLTDQVNNIKYGVRSHNPKLLQNLELTAYHEAGHAIASMAVNPEVLIEQVTVMPRGNALGFVSYDKESAQYRQYNRQEVLDSICVFLAGRIAQTRQFPEFGDDAGASSDLEQANSLAMQAITKLGLDEKLGNVVVSFDGKTPSLVDSKVLLERVQAWLQEAEEQCVKVIDEHWDKVDALAKYLIEEEVITGEKLREEFKLS